MNCPQDPLGPVDEAQLLRDTADEIRRKTSRLLAQAAVLRHTAAELCADASALRSRQSKKGARAGENQG